MREDKQVNQLSGPRKIALNAFILTAIALIYVLIMSPAVHIAVAGTNPAYRGTDQSAVALQCVVNWDAAAVGPMLDIFKEKGARITFFVSADWALRNSTLLMRMAEDGHEIGCYGNIASGGGGDYRNDMKRIREAVRSQCGIIPRLYMPALEEAPLACLNAARAEKMQCVLYSLDLQAAKASSAELISERALENPFGGALVRFTPTAHMLTAMPVIVDKLTENGFMLKPVGETLGTRIV